MRQGRYGELLNGCTCPDAYGEVVWRENCPLHGNGSFGRALDVAVRAKLAYVDANKESLVTAWSAETGLKPSESMLVIQEHGNGRMTVRVERKTDRECSCGRPLSPGKCRVCDRDE